MSRKLKQRVLKVIAGLSCVMFTQATLFPFVAAAQMVTVAPVPVVTPVVAAPIHLPSVIPSVLEKEKFVDVNKGSFSFLRTDYVAPLRLYIDLLGPENREQLSPQAIFSLSRPSEKLDGRASSGI